MNKKIKGLKTLEKINDHKLDELRLILSQLRAREEALQQEKTIQREREMREKSITSNHPHLGQTLSAYMESIDLKLKAIGREIDQINLDVESILDEMRDLYQNGKKLESVIHQVNQEIKKEELRQEQKIMDHLAEIRHIHSS